MSKTKKVTLDTQKRLHELARKIQDAYDTTERLLVKVQHVGTIAEAMRAEINKAASEAVGFSRDGIFSIVAPDVAATAELANGTEPVRELSPQQIAPPHHELTGAAREVAGRAAQREPLILADLSRQTEQTRPAVN